MGQVTNTLPCELEPTTTIQWEGVVWIVDSPHWV